jgi:hypothetical protein
MENNFCSFCYKKFSTKYNLKRHEEKYCEKNDKNENDKNEISIVLMPSKETENFCEKNYHKNEKKFSQTKNNKNHQENSNDINLLIKENKNLKLKISKYKKREENHCATLKLLETYKEIENEYKHKIYQLEQTIEKLASKAIENAGIKTTTINNRNQIYQSLQPLTDDHMKDQTQHLTYKDVKNGIEGIAYFASNYTFKDRVFCSDKSRLNFVFKNENDIIIKDPEGIEITNKFIEINKNELLRFLEEYFSFIKQQLDKDLDIAEYKHWAKRREEIITVKSAVKRGNIPENKDSYDEFKRSFLSVLSELVPR